MGDGSGDLQAVWHKFVGKYFTNKTILDIGAGLGKSKERLSIGNNHVCTQDINRARMLCVDTTTPIGRLMPKKYDIVTAFDVVEHVTVVKEFVNEMFNLAREGIFITTPNYYKFSSPWHYTALEFINLFLFYKKQDNFKYFARYKNENSDRVLEVSERIFSRKDNSIYALGLFVIKF